MKKNIIIVACMFIISYNWAQKYSSEELFIKSFDALKLSGTLLYPQKVEAPIDLVIIISGTGPTDREGNSGEMTNNAIKLLAEGISNHKRATFRYDKRGVGKSLHASIKEEDLRIEHYVKDVLALVHFFQTDQRFSSISIIGHDDGALIGMLACQKVGVKQFISISGCGRTANLLLEDQLARQYNKHKTKVILDSLKMGCQVHSLGQLHRLFRPSVQPYMMSWFKYDPIEELTKLTCPVLVLQGDKDIQVKVKEADLLHSAKPEAEYSLVSNMNHIFRVIKGDFNENIKSYYNSELPISKVLLKKIMNFLNHYDTTISSSEVN